jgi:hypothetical protein
MSPVLPSRLLTDDDREYLTRWPVECTEEVTRKRRGESWAEPCEALAVAARFDPNEGSAYPVCGRHVRGEMASLADLLEVADLWAKETER